MPALPDVNKVLRVDLTFLIDEDLGAKVRFYKRYAGVAPTSGQLNTFAGDVGDLFASSGLAGHMVDEYALTLTEVTDLTSPTAAFGSDATDHPGTDSTNDHLIASACVLVSHRLARRYRGGHPRNYWPLGTVDDLDDSQTFTDAFVASVQTDMDSFYGGINALGWTSAGTIDSVNVSYYEGFTVFIGPTGRARNISTVRDEAVIDTITAHVVQKGIASQRGRLLHLA